MFVLLGRVFEERRFTLYADGDCAVFHVFTLDPPLSCNTHPVEFNITWAYINIYEGWALMLYSGLRNEVWIAFYQLKPCRCWRANSMCHKWSKLFSVYLLERWLKSKTSLNIYRSSQTISDVKEAKHKGRAIKPCYNNIIIYKIYIAPCQICKKIALKRFAQLTRIRIIEVFGRISCESKPSVKHV